ncbi:hypothetical protein VP01_5706g1, partial [Puccinia sorghi]
NTSNSKKATPIPKKATLKTKKPPKKPAIHDAIDKTAGHLKKDNYLVIIKWLKIERNYNSCSGTAINLTPHQMKDQFNTYTDKYKKVHTKFILAGFGLTNEDQKAGISTINEKLESMLMHNLKTKLQNLPLLSLLEMKLEAVT